MNPPLHFELYDTIRVGDPFIKEQSDILALGQTENDWTKSHSSPYMGESGTHTMLTSIMVDTIFIPYVNYYCML